MLSNSSIIWHTASPYPVIKCSGLHVLALWAPNFFRSVSSLVKASVRLPLKSLKGTKTPSFFD